MKKIIGKVLLLSCCALIFDVVGSSGQSVSESPHIQVDTENPTPAHDDLCTVQTGVDHSVSGYETGKGGDAQESAEALMRMIKLLDKVISQASRLWNLTASDVISREYNMAALQNRTSAISQCDLHKDQTCVDQSTEALTRMIELLDKSISGASEIWKLTASFVILKKKKVSALQALTSELSGKTLEEVNEFLSTQFGDQST